MFKKWTERERLSEFFISEMKIYPAFYLNENISEGYLYFIMCECDCPDISQSYIIPCLYGFSLIWTESSCVHLMLVWFLSYQRRVHFCPPEPLSSMVWQLVAWHCICFSISIVWLDLWSFDISWFTWFSHLVMSSEYLMLVILFW
jgi:hypothetical protein